MAEKVDLNAIIANSNYVLNADNVERIELMNARIARENRESKIQQGKDIAVFICAIVIVGTLFVISVYVFLDTTFSADDRKWAAAGLTSIATGFIAFITGRQVGKADTK